MCQSHILVFTCAVVYDVLYYCTTLYVHTNVELLNISFSVSLGGCTVVLWINPF